MIDSMTGAHLYVSTDGTAGPYIVVPVSQLGNIRQLLDNHGVGYSVEEDMISLDGVNEVAILDLGRGANVETIQAILDSGA